MGEPRKQEATESTQVSECVPGEPIVAMETGNPNGEHQGTIQSDPGTFPGFRGQLNSLSGLTEVERPEGSFTDATASATASPLDATQAAPQGYSGPTFEEKDPSGWTMDPASSGSSGPVVGRFALKGLHARGGLGEVFKARDIELNREVALKRIQARYADDPSSRRRFLSEAELTARLDHPGVVPVFGLVADGHGRPCYAMRFIRGETLKDEIERYHQLPAAQSRSAPTVPDGTTAPAKSSVPNNESNQPRSVAFRHLLQRFISVCQAIAYAHTRKVIHRDIKPANVMVGTFGETLVVDWGLAKSLDDSPLPEELLKQAASAGFRHDPEATELPDHLTQAGTAVGTPAYMAPEQASGRIDLIGPAADIYSLGATLFAILTGKAPFTGSTAETLERVRRGEFPSPREVNPEVPAPLNAICRKATALAISERYSTALELSTDVERWLSDEPVSCYPDPFTARVARWARRHPARVAAGVSLLLAGVFAAIVIAVAVNSERGKTKRALDDLKLAQEETIVERDRAQDARQSTEEVNVRLRDQKNATERERNRALEARDLASERYESAVEAYNTLVSDIQLRLADQAGTQEFRRTLLLAAQKGLNGLIAKRQKGSPIDSLGADRTLVAAHLQLGNLYQLLGDTHDAIEQYKDAVKKALVVHNMTMKRGRPDEEAAALRDLGLSDLALASVQLQAGHTTAAEDACKAAIDLFGELLSRDKTQRTAREDLASALDKYGDVFIESGKTKEAEEQCKHALAIRTAIAQERKDDWSAQRGLAESYDQYAEILLRAGKSQEARDMAEKSLSLREVVAKKQPDQPAAIRERASARARLGEIAFDRVELPESRKQYDAAHTILNELLVKDPLNATARLAQVQNCRRLAAVALMNGDLTECETFVNECERLCRELRELDPKATATRREIAALHDQHGELLLVRGKSGDALKEFRESESILEQIRKNDPDSLLARLAVAHAWSQVGVGELAAGQSKAAIVALKKSVSIREEDLDSLKARRDLAQGLSRLAEAYRVDRQLGPASESLSRAVALLRQVLAEDQSFRPSQRELAESLGNWGELQAEQGHSTVALIIERQSLALFQGLLKADPGNAHAQIDLAAAWERLAALYARIGQPEQATAAAGEGLKLLNTLTERDGETHAARREKAVAMIRVADGYMGASDFAVARKWYREAIKQVSGDSEDVRTAQAARLATEKLALVDAMAALADDPGMKLTEIPVAQRTMVLTGACNWLLKTNKPVSAESLALQLAASSQEPAALYQAAVVLARCALVPKITQDAKTRFSQEAVQTLEAAITANFQDGQLLALPEWDACRALPSFQKLLERLTPAKKP